MPEYFILGPAGPIEAAVQPTPHAVRAVAVVCHPHPLYGGTMDNKVVTTAARALVESGAETWRFNFRGTGKSAGTHDHGRGEQDDLHAVVAHARAQRPELPLWLAGFSFGAYVSICSAESLAAARLISIAPPAGKWDFSGLREPSMPWWVVQGDQDEVIPPETVYAWLASLMVPPTLIRMSSASHFFHGELSALKNHLMQALA